MHTQTKRHYGDLNILIKKVFHTSPHSANSTHSRELLNIYSNNKTTTKQLSKICRSS